MASRTQSAAVKRSEASGRTYMSTATERDCKHKHNILAKAETLDGLRALYQEWALVLHPSDPYMRHLKERIHKIQTLLKNMRP